MELPILDQFPQADFLKQLGESSDTSADVAPLPMSMKEARKRGWDEIDIVFVTGDAYIDHPSFAMAILGRVLEAPRRLFAGFRARSHVDVFEDRALRGWTAVA